jgi:hypothetical protein
MSIRRNLNEGDVVVMGHDGFFIQRKPGAKVHKTPTGFGDEVYYHDDQGLLRHFPPRTKYSHPYSYDPIVLLDSGTEGDGSAYSDRMVGWDYNKFYACMGKINDGKGEMCFRWGSRELVTAFMRDYNDDPGLIVTRVVEMCNVSNGYPVWLVVYKKGPEVKKFQLSYGSAKNMTVTVKAKNFTEALDKAKAVMERRYEKRDLEPPVGWTLTLVKVTAI